MSESGPALAAGPPPAAGTAAATAARRVRADLKRGMEFSGESLRAAHRMAAENPAVARIPVRELLAAMPGLGPRRADDLALHAGIAPGRRLSGLGPHQLATLAALIDERAARRGSRSAS